VLANYLAHRCLPEQLGKVLLGFKEVRSISSQRMAEAFLGKVLLSKDSNKICHAFSTYWSFYEDFHIQEPRPELLLIEPVIARKSRFLADSNKADAYLRAEAKLL
jgi:hypothetical protein